jgi:membrane-bound lytic murein transglycosylase D
VPVDTDSLGKSRQETIRHTVTSGENLVTIANRYGVTAANLRQWNGFKSNSVAPGRRITVHINNGGITFAAPPSPPATAATANGGAPSQLITYTVQSGDTLLAIARKYPGMTVAKIKAANQMTSDRLGIGQILKIPIGG